MRNLILLNWRQKLIALLLATAIWAGLKEWIEPGTFDQILSGTAIHPK
jgi:hypothetical protein